MAYIFKVNLGDPVEIVTLYLAQPNPRGIVTGWRQHLNDERSIEVSWWSESTYRSAWFSEDQVKALL